MNLSKKEKAIELIEFFKPIVYSHVGSGFLTGDHDKELILSNAKLCAIKCVEELLYFSDTQANGDQKGNSVDKNWIEYFQEVKQEIENYGR